VEVADDHLHPISTPSPPRLLQKGQTTPASLVGVLKEAEGCGFRLKILFYYISRKKMPPAICPSDSAPTVSITDLPALPVPITPKEIILTQKFSRSAVGFLWDRRADLDPGQVAILNALYNNRKKGSITCEQSITYRLSKSKIGQLGYGRMYGSKGSLETLERECRGTVCKKFYKDVDVKNCHPVLLLQYAKHYFNQDLPEVEKLCENREAYMKEAGGSRDDAKQEIIRIIYGGKPKIAFFEPLYKEVSAFTKKLSKNPHYEELFNECKKQNKNIYGSFLSYILQTEERTCMFAIKKCLEAFGWKVGVLSYDGVMVEERADADLIADLRGAEKFIEETTGYVVELTDKEMESFKEFDDSKSSETMNGIPKETYDDMKRMFEMTNFYYAPTNEYFEITQGEEPLRMSLEHATTYYGRKWFHKISDKFGDYIEFFPVWRKDLTARTIKRLDMKPSDDPEVYVCPPIFKYEKEGEVSTEGLVAFHLLLNLITKKDEVVSGYVEKWLAHLVQKPFENPGVALIITGSKGIGKDTLMDFMIEYVVGTQYGFSYGSSTQFFDKHDTNRMNKFLVKLEEANREICYKNADELKARITSNTTSFNPKNQKVIVCPNYTRYVFTVNGACPVDMSDSERRFLLIPASAEKKGDSDFWIKMRDTLFTPEAGRAVAQYLKSIDLSDFNIRKYPQTTYQTEIINSKKTAEEMFVENWDGAELNSGELYQAYKEFCIEKEIPFSRNVISFTRSNNLQILKRDGAIKVRILHGVTVYTK